MSHKERATRVVLAGVGTALVFSLLLGHLWTTSMLWEIAFWIAVFGALSPLDSLAQRRRRAKRL